MTRSGPHQTRIGKAQLRHVLTDVRRDCGQPSTGPSTERDQSWDRIRAPISPAPARNETAVAVFAIAATAPTSDMLHCPRGELARLFNVTLRLRFRTRCSFAPHSLDIYGDFALIRRRSSTPARSPDPRAFAFAPPATRRVSWPKRQPARPRARTKHLRPPTRS